MSDFDIEEKKELDIKSALLEVCKNPAVDPDKLEKLLDIQIKMEDRQKLQAFNEAFASFQQDCPIIPKTKKVDFKSKSGNTTKYDYAPLDEIVYLIKPVMGRNGLSFAFNITQGENITILTTSISHKEGHSKNFQYFFNELHDDTRMNESQRRKSAITFAKRAAIENALGIVTAGEDDDARRAIESGSLEVLQEIRKLVSEVKNFDEKAFFNYLKIENIDELELASAADLGAGLIALRKKDKK